MKQKIFLYILLLPSFWLQSNHAFSQKPADTIRARVWDSLTIKILDARRSIKEARPYLDSLRWVRSKFPGTDSIPYADWLFKEAIYHFYTRNPRLEQGLEWMQQVIRLREKSGKYPPDSHPMAFAYNMLGLLQSKVGQHLLALQSHRQALSIRESIARKQGIFNYRNMLAHSYANVGMALANLGQYDQSIAFISLALPYMRDSALTHPELLAHEPILCANLGSNYLATHDYALAEDYFQKALRSFGLSSSEEALIWVNRGSNYAYWGKNALADSCFANAKKLLQKAGTTKHISGVMRQMQGLLLLDAGYFDAGEDSLRQALKIFTDVLGKEDPVVSGAYFNLGLCFYIQNQPDSTRHYAQLAEQALGQKPAEISFHHFSRSKGLIARSWIQSYRNGGKKDKDLLEKALAEVQEVETVFNHFVTGLEGELRFFNMAEGLKFAVEPALAAHFFLHEHDQSPAHIEEAFRLSEKTKASLWLENYRIRHDFADKGLPTSEERQSRQKQFRKELSDLKTRLFIAQSKYGDMPNAEVDNINRSILNLNRSHSDYLDSLEKKDPTLLAVRYRIATTPADKVRLHLDADEVMLSYFISDSSVFIFVLSPDEMRLEMQERTFLRPSIVHLTNALRQEHEKLNPVLTKSAVNTYVSEAKFLYSRLIAPVQPLLDKETRIIVIPDETLCYLPFEVLLEKGEAGDFPKLDYLAYKHSFRYGYSATSLLEMTKKVHRVEPSVRYLGVAPVFSNSQTTIRGTSLPHGIPFTGTLDSLLENVPEVCNVLNIIGEGDTLIGHAADKKTFLSRARKCQIILLSTHAVTDEYINEYSFVAFSASSTDNPASGCLIMTEIDTTTLNCDLLVLSACKTAFGRLRKGEGVISLARMFAFSGAKSLLSTLWSTNDVSSRELTESFFKNLKMGQTKDKALQNAKITYLQKHFEKDTGSTKREKTFPFYWAQFIMVGDDAPLWPKQK